MKIEDVNYDDFWDKLGEFIRRKHLEPMFAEAQRSIEQTEYIYDEVREGLSPSRDDDLVMYVASCEDFCKTYAFAAYEMGREEGPRKPEEALDNWVGSPEFWTEILRKFNEEGGLGKKELELMYEAGDTMPERLRNG